MDSVVAYLCGDCKAFYLSQEKIPACPCCQDNRCIPLGYISIKRFIKKYASQLE